MGSMLGWGRDGRVGAWLWAMALVCLPAMGWGQGVAVQAALGVRQASARQPYLAARMVRGGGSAAEALMVARLEHLHMAARPRGANLSASWTSVGPGSVANPMYGAVSGRVTAIVVDPGDATGNTVYVGTTGGGVWKSVNAAGPAGTVTFLPLTDTLPVFDLSAGSSAIASLSIGSLAMGGGVLLAGTGDPNDASDSYYGQGILRSADGGLTWTLATSAGDGTNPNRRFAGLSVAAIAFSTANPRVVVAGVGQSFEGGLVNAGNQANALKGLYVSGDAGVTWTPATVMDGGQVVESAAQVPADGGGNGVTAVVWNPVRQMFFAALSGHGYYGSADGMNWSRLAGQPGEGMTLSNCPTVTALDANCPIFRGALAVNASTGDMFALTVDASDGDRGLYRDVCGMTAGGACGSAEAFGVKLNSAPLEVGGGSAGIVQGSYNLALAAVASGTDTLLYVGTVDLYRCSLAAGCVLRDTTNAQNGCATPAGVAGAQHAIGLGLPPTIFTGNDGGLWRSADGAAETGGVCSAADAGHFDDLNGGLGSLAEVVGFAQDPVQTGTLLAGFGALGSAGTGTAAAGGSWAQMSTGEGGAAAIDPAHPLNWYVTTGAGVEIATCAKGSACGVADFATTSIGAAQVDGDASLVHAAWTLDPGTTGEVLVGTCRAWRGTAAAWATNDLLSAPFAASGAGACGPTFGLVRSWGAGGAVAAGASAPAAGSEVLYAGMAGVEDGGAGVGGHLFTTAAAESTGSATAWRDAALASVTNDANDAGVFNPGGFDVSSIAVDPHDPTGKTVYATVMGFAGNGVNAPHLYRSTNGGASWLNVNANLPNAPANAVAVDPNDANTVYVGMDTGVYVTTSITTCATPGANCWEVYGVGLPNSPVMQVVPAAAMTTGDGRTGELRVGLYGRGIWQIPLLSAVSPAAPAMTLSPASLSFPSQQVGTESASVTVTVTNSGNAPLTVTSVVTTGDFVEMDGCSGTSVGAGLTCSVAVNFAPTATGTRGGLLTVYGDVAGGQATAMLSGVATAPASVVLTPTSLSFGSENVGSMTMAQNVTISNTGGTDVTLQPVTIAGEFSISANTCGATLAASTGCTVSVKFAPTSSGVQSGILTVVDGVGTQTAELMGTGVNPATDGLTPLSLAFGAQQITNASAAQQVTLTNAGDVALTLVSAAVTGDFAVVNGCGATLTAHSACAFEVTYVPKNVGAEAGVLTVSDEYRAQTVALTGTGVAPPGVSLAPAGGLSFSGIAVGQSSAGQVVTLTNNGGLPLALGGVMVSGDFAVAASSCGSFVAAGANCQVTLAFAPSAAGARSGTLTFTDNAASSPQSLALSGVGIDFALSADGPVSQTVTSGQTATYLLLLTSVKGVPGDAVFTCSGVPAAAKCTVTPSTSSLSAAVGTVITVTIATGVSGARMEEPRLPWNGPGGWLAVVRPVGWAARRQRQRRGRGRGIGLLLMAGLMGCTTIGRTIPAGGGGGGSAPPPVTPSGSYTIVVAGSSAGLVRAVDFTLVVQ
jgi:hypothetical protein